VRQGGICAGKIPPVSLREPSPLFHRGDTWWSTIWRENIFGAQFEMKKVRADIEMLDMESNVRY
jgi:hypothetical protein